MKKIMVVMGTRPEAIKLCPVVRELQRREGLSAIVCSTGQHGSLLQGAMQAFGVGADIDLKLMRLRQGLTEITARVLAGMGAVLEQTKPDALLVQGDTASAYGAALAGFYQRIPVGHIEAGLRTYHTHSPFPEELHRVGISLMADYHFAPTASAKNNLIREGKKESRVFLTGNTVVDALHYTLCQAPPKELRFSGARRLLLFTAHRRESQGEPLRQMLRALRRIVDAHEDVLAICPLHPNPAVRACAEEMIKDHARIRVIEPPQTIGFHHLLAKSHLVLTDSGGIQEESTALGIPTLVMRHSTERREGIRAGVLKLCGSGEEGIVAAANRLLEPNSAEYAAMRHPSRIFGDGHAAQRIVSILSRALGA